MKYKLKKYILIILTALACYGCEKYVPYVNAPVFEQKLVVSSFLSPSDSVSYISVTSNQPVYQIVYQEEKTGALNGTLSDGITEIELDTTETGFVFRNDRMPLVQGHTYTVRISSDKGLYAEASATIPAIKDFMIEIDTETIVHESHGFYENWKEFKISAEFSDDPGETNFYSVTGRFTGYKTNTGQEPKKYKERLWFEGSIVKDQKKDENNRIKLDTRFYNSFSYYDSAFITVFVMNTEESYYLYHKSLEEYTGSDNPFSEAKPVYSNIKGGLGIFTSYTLDSVRLRIK